MRIINFKIIERCSKDPIITNYFSFLFSIKGNTLLFSYSYVNKSIFDNYYSRKDNISLEAEKVALQKKYIKALFKTSILKGFKVDEDSKIVLNDSKIIIICNKSKYHLDAINFSYELKNILKDYNIRIELYIDMNNTFNENIAIKYDNNKIIGAIAGTSTLTPKYLWYNDKYDYSIDIFYWDKYKLKNQKELLDKIILAERKYIKDNNIIDKIISYNLIKENEIETYLNLNNIISPLEFKNVSDALNKKLNYNTIKYVIDKNRLLILIELYNYLIYYYSESAVICKALNENHNTYINSINNKDILKTINVIDNNIILTSIKFKTSTTIIPLKELIIEILQSDNVSNIFSYKENGFIKYFYNRIGNEKIL